MYVNLTRILVVILFCFVLSACQTETKTEETVKTDTTKVVEKKEISSVCIWDKASFRADPTKNGKWISSMALGEKVIWLGDVGIDSTDKDRKYLKLRLSDGKEGWASEYVIATDAIPAVITKKAALYKRPDLLTVTGKELEPMTFVAILQTNDEWMEVTGEENKNKGWIQSKFVSSKDEDVAVGLLAAKALAEKDEEKMKEKIEFILGNTQFAHSVFISDLETKINELTTQVEETVTEESDSTKVMQ